MFHQYRMSSKSSVDPVHGELWEMLICQVCMETVRPPIYRCRNEHFLCSKCVCKVNICPTCRVPMRQRVRSRMMEKVAEIARYPCINSSQGCPEWLLLSSKDAHETQCCFREASRCATCPLLYTCPWAGGLGDVGEHVRQQHAGEVKVEPTGLFEVAAGSYGVVHFDGQLFSVRAEAAREGDCTHHYFHVGRVSQDTKAANTWYLYDVVAQPDGTEYSGDVGNYQQPLQDLAAAGDCLFFVGPSADKQELVKYSVTITRLT